MGLERFQLYLSKKKNKFDENEWDYQEKDGKIILTGYKGYSSKVVFPSGENYLVGDEWGDFNWGPNYHRIEEIDFSNINLVSERFLPLPKSTIKRIKNICPNCSHFDDVFRDNSSIEEIDLPEHLVSCTGTFESSSIKNGFDIKGEVEVLCNTYEKCKNMRTPGSIPKATRELLGTFRESGIFCGLDLSGTGVDSLIATYLECHDLIDTGNFNDNILIMVSTYANCYNLQVIRKLPDKCRFMNRVFSRCKEIKVQPTLPKDLRIAEELFSGCSITRAKKIPDNVLSTVRMYEDNVKLIEGTDVPNSVIDCSYMYSNCPKLKKGVNIGRSVISARFMYYKCITMESAPDLPDNVKFAPYMFMDCYRLKKAPKLGKVIDISSMFKRCKTLQQAPVIPETVEYMPNVFEECDLLQGDIIILSKKVKVADNAFSHSKYLRRIHLDFNSETYKAFESAGLTKKQKLLNIELVPLSEVRNG